MNLSVGEEFGAHVIQVVAFLKMPVIIPQRLVVEDGELLLQTVQLIV